MAYDRYQIEIGSKVKVNKIYGGVEANGLPYWKFCVPFITHKNSTQITFKYLWCKVIGRADVQEGEFVRVTNILKYHASCVPANNGGTKIYETLTIEIERLSTGDE